MHFAFVLRCKLPNGKICHLAWQKLASSRKEMEKHIRESFAKNGAYLPGNHPPGKSELLELIEAGECKEGYENSTQLYEDACNKARKLDEKEAKAAKTPKIEPATVEDKAA